MKKIALLLTLLLALLPAVALASSDASFQFSNKWYGFDYDKAEFEDGYLVVYVTCPDGLPIVNGVPTVPVTGAVDVNGERLEPVNTNVSILGSYAYYFFYYNTDAMPDAVWLYPDGDIHHAKLLWGTPTAPTPEPTPSPVPTPTPEPTPDPLADFESVTFGHYDQDANPDNGAEPIEWLVLERDDEKAMLISKYGLDEIPYNTEKEQVTWESCTLRRWLNDDFLNAAFTEEEQAQLMMVTVAAVPNPGYPETDPGNDTQDRVFLLSPDEVLKYFPLDETRVCYETETADEYHGKCAWWLRWSVSPYYFVGAIVSDEGNVWTNNADVYSKWQAVRPVIVLWTSSEPMPTPTPVPYRTLQKGSKGEDVKKLQQALIDGGFLNGKADGDFGNMTDAAVRAAQETFGLEVNGVADDAFQKRLYGE